MQDFSNRYLSHFLLVEVPFALTPDPKFFYLSDQHSEALAALDIAITERRGLVTLVGEVGTGKTTLARTVLEGLGADTRVAYVSITTLPFEDLLRDALDQWRVPIEEPTKGGMIRALRSFVEQQAERGGTVVLVVDEAQHLTNEVFEELRLLLNLETPESKLLQLVLIGQPELQQKLLQPEIRQLAERASVRAYLGPLEREESLHYIRHRIEVAGGHPRIFSEPALKRLVRASGGVPRAINALSHSALIFAFGRGSRTVELPDVDQAIAERRAEALAPKRPTWLKPVLVGLAAALVLVVVAWLAWRLWPGSGQSTGAVEQTRSAPVEATTPETAPAEASEMRADPSEGVADPLGETEAVSLRPVAGSLGDSGPDARRQAAAGVAPEPESDESRGALAEVGEPPRGIVAAGETGDEFVTVTVGPGQSVSDLMMEVYGRYRPDLLDEVRAANPGLADFRRIRTGTEIRFPRVEE